MAINAAPIPAARTDVWHGRFGAPLALGLVVLPFAAILLWYALSGTTDQATLAAEIRTTATVVDEHAAAMIRIGDRISQSAATSSAPDRATWAAYGVHMISDGRGLQDLAARLRTTATVAQADQLHRGSIQLGEAALKARWEQLRADGEATAAHGRVMVDMARDLNGGIASGIITASDAREIQQASQGMVDAGDRVVRAADRLLALVDQMQRWMGFPR